MPDKCPILLADDHAVVGEACDGAAAVVQAVALDPDLVILDVSMPGVNGVAAAEQLRREKPARKIVALSVHEDKG
ncbi:response regulator [Limnoglobus roseus]|uniref:DNA-binding response regulator n=1 Tax=Limnoglobus roseus TaxID=2598579 RepID=A0A5C1AR12_9BACT|nr:response regulator transcription factor [Limnoglobus roseus]QEL20647.1 DNA-binding response regulator [Limnoglobus roseus]